MRINRRNIVITYGKIDQYKLNKKLKLLLKLLPIILFIFAIPCAEAQFRETYYERGYKEIRKGNYNKAVEYFNYSIDDRNYYQAYFFRAYSKFQLGDLIGSEQDFSSCLAEIPNHRDALHYRAIVRSQLLDIEGSFEDFENAIKYDSTNAEIYFNRAIALLTIQNYEAAIKDCNQAIKYDGKNQKAIIIRAVAETELGDYDKAIDDFNSVLLKNPI